ncbi:unnamed protein product [Moneuplotes crassus]|uniref:Uncharacterized protein n=1 Tax=Euplotes crassus TaxID=5936 RepID=A0AAD2D4X4_EUPCR|nr:unnamed protein product [Moneuplotes crassus]
MPTCYNPGVHSLYLKFIKISKKLSQVFLISKIKSILQQSYHIYFLILGEV